MCQLAPGHCLVMCALWMTGHDGISKTCNFLWNEGWQWWQQRVVTHMGGFSMQCVHVCCCVRLTLTCTVSDTVVAVETANTLAANAVVHTGSRMETQPTASTQHCAVFQCIHNIHTIQWRSRVEVVILTGMQCFLSGAQVRMEAVCGLIKDEQEVVWDQGCEVGNWV